MVLEEHGQLRKRSVVLARVDAHASGIFLRLATASTLVSLMPEMEDTFHGLSFKICTLVG